MIRFTLPGMSAVLSLMFAAPTSAQAIVNEPRVCQLPIEAQDVPSAPTASALPPGCETTTLPWSAPVGHRQPQLADVTSSTTSLIDQAVVEENARVDRLIKGICRGC
jgi:hypothetical protein